MQTELVLQTKNRSGPAKNRFSVALVYTVCHYICIFWTHYSMVEPYDSNFRIITAIFQVSEIFGHKISHGERRVKGHLYSALIIKE